MASFLNDNEDLRYYLQDGIDWAAVSSLTEHGFRLADGWKNATEAQGFYGDVAALVGELAAEEVAPHAAEIDREGIRFEKGEAIFPPRLQAIHDRIAAQGLHGMILPRDLGGMNAPVLLHFVCEELLARADVSVMTHYGFHGGMALAMLALSRLEGSTEFDATTGKVARTRWAAEISEVAAGKAWGSMDITESDAGSDMAALRMVGEQSDSGEWTVTGQKIFITSGHGKYHFVIARTEKPSGPEDPRAGLGGLSMFLVRAYRDEADGTRTRLATLDRVEEKLGHHGSATVAISFDHTPAELVGKRGEGFRQMLEIMNHARLGVGFESIGLGEAALRMARAYAAERRSMGRPLDHHEMIADYLDEMEIDLIGLRALAMHGAFHDELASRMTLLGNSDSGAIARHKAAARRATPLLKYLAAEKAVELARRNLQIHGGNGYMREFGAEKLLRDALVMPIYEGTSQIQALMAMKDTLGAITKAPPLFVKRVAQARWRALSARDALERRVARLQQISLGAQQHLITRTVAGKMKSEPMARWGKALFTGLDPRRDFAHALLHAERLTRILADEHIAEVLLAQAQRHPQRRELLERYLDRAEPRCRALAEEISSTGARIISRLSPPAETKAAG
jgi:alkylation response protein AidB-like acyl-CoA dehydrogenase